MALLLSEDQVMLADSAREFLDAEAPPSRFRALRDAGKVHDADLWARLVELGWPSIPFSEDQGGLGMGLAEVAIVIEAMGYRLVAAPMVSAVGASVLDPSFGAQAGRVLGVAWREHARDRDPARVATVATDGRITGRKLGVLDGTTAEAFVVSARVGDEIGLFRVKASDATVIPLSRIDHRDAADVVFEGAPGERLDGGLDLLRRGVEAMDVANAAEWLGGMCGAFDRTKAYLHERRQFGVPIGSFQALQHRAVDLFIQIELCRSAVMQAAREPTSAWVELARIKCAETYLAVAKESVQMHGGIGMTDECDIGFFTKRAMVAAFG